jgi:uncharacterized metal-binding protein YceD (DUF177 family)
MIIDIPKLSPEGSSFTGELPGTILQLEEDKFARADGPVTYDLFAYVVSHELIVKGEVAAPVKLLCGRCGGFFSTKLSVSSFLRGYPISDGVDKVDLTEDIREDLVIEIPSYPRCAYEGAGVCPFSGVNLDELSVKAAPPVVSPWSVLDKLKD